MLRGPPSAQYAQARRCGRAFWGGRAPQREWCRPVRVCGGSTDAPAPFRCLPIGGWRCPGAAECRVGPTQASCRLTTGLRNRANREGTATSRPRCTPWCRSGPSSSNPPATTSPAAPPRRRPAGRSNAAWLATSPETPTAFLESAKGTARRSIGASRERTRREGGADERRHSRGRGCGCAVRGGPFTARRHRLGSLMRRQLAHRLSRSPLGGRATASRRHGSDCWRSRARACPTPPCSVPWHAPEESQRLHGDRE